MSTSSSSITSSLFTPLQFTGISQYSSDFQSILTRAEAINQLPVTALQNRQTTIQQQETDLTSLSTSATAVGSALAALGQLTGSVTSSDSNVVTATNNGVAAGSTYTITNVTSVASQASESSRTSYVGTAPVSSSPTQTMQLVVGSKSYTITLDGVTKDGKGIAEPNTLAGLQKAISNSGADVTASIVTTASGSYLSVTSNNSGVTPIQIIDDPQSSVNTLTAGNPGDSVTAASATLTATYPDTDTTAVSPSGSLQLVVGGKTYGITLPAGQNNLTGLQNAINGLNAGVTASISSSQPYQLSITANSVGANTLQLLESPTNFLTSNNPGTNTVFDLNGIHISEAGTSITDAIPGMTFNFAGKTATSPAETVTVKVGATSTNIKSALQTLVDSYNALATAENAQLGRSGGSLNGNNIIYQVRQAMSSIVQYGGSGGNLANFGIEMDINGQMSLNQQTFNALSPSQVSAGLQLLGTATTGIGGLQQAFATITDPISGSIKAQETQWAKTVTNLTAEINTKLLSNSALQQRLNQQLQAADALEAQLQSQQTMLTSSITSLNFSSYGYNSTNPASGG